MLIHYNRVSTAAEPGRAYVPLVRNPMLRETPLHWLVASRWSSWKPLWQWYFKAQTALGREEMLTMHGYNPSEWQRLFDNWDAEGESR